MNDTINDADESDEPETRTARILKRKAALDTPQAAGPNRSTAAYPAPGFEDFAGGSPDDMLEQPMGEWPWGSHTTKALEALKLAGEKFWRNYDPSDPTTGPTNQVVIDFLVDKAGMSETMAASMASILRADDLKFGPRPK